MYGHPPLHESNLYGMQPSTGGTIVSDRDMFAHSTYPLSYKYFDGHHSRERSPQRNYDGHNSRERSPQRNYDYEGQYFKERSPQRNRYPVTSSHIDLKTHVGLTSQNNGINENMERDNGVVHERSRSRHRNSTERHHHRIKITPARAWSPKQRSKSPRKRTRKRKESRDNNLEHVPKKKNVVQLEGEIIVKNLPPNTSWRDIDDLFDSEIGKVTYSEVIDEGTCAIVKFKTLDDAKKAVQKMKNYSFFGSKLRIIETTAGLRKVFPPKKSKHNDGNNTSSEDLKWGNTYGVSHAFLESLKITPPLVSKVMVKNLHPSITPFKLTEVFNIAGKVTHVNIWYDSASVSTGCGIVEYEHKLEAVQAISMLHNQTLLNKRIKVILYHEPTDSVRILPDGLEDVGIGIGLDGTALRDIAKLMKNLEDDEEESDTKSVVIIDVEEDNKCEEINLEDNVETIDSPEDSNNFQIIEEHLHDTEVPKHQLKVARVPSPPPGTTTSPLLGRNILNMCLNRQGVIMLEERISHGSELEFKTIFTEVTNYFLKIVKNVFGVSVPIKLLEYTTVEQKQFITNIVQRESSMKCLAFDKYAHQFVCKVIELCPLPIQLDTIKMLKGNAVLACKNNYGRHVIETCLEVMGSNYIQFITDELHGHVIEVLKCEEGFEVIKKILLNLPKNLSGPIFDEILSNASYIISDDCACKIINIILDNGQLNQTHHLIETIKGVFVYIAQKKNSFHILSQCLQLATEDQINFFINQLCGTDDAGLTVMMQDQHAQLVLIELVRACSLEQKQYIIRKILQYSKNIMRLNYSETFLSTIRRFQCQF